MDAVLDLPASTEDPNTEPADALIEREWRFLLSRPQTIAFLHAVRATTVPELYDRARPLAFTRTTYLDTLDRRYLRSCASKVARRLRLREYALAANLTEVPLLSGICFLELKQSAGARRTKVRLEAHPRALESLLAGVSNLALRNDSIESRAALAALRAEVEAHQPVPCLTTWYRRACLTADEGRVRITLDQDLCFCEPQRLGEQGEAATPNRIVARGPARILEVKYRGEAPAWLARATVGLPAAPHFSKFRAGMLALQRQAM
jgi:hypothetical protein